ncbi:MAG: histidinol dehydrogenase [Rhodospirillales bacterium]|nr:histidinol dehydrogenase [Rhodospirillales bacterium]
MKLRMDISDAGFEDAFRGLLNDKRETETDVRDVVAGILADVRKRGDEAVLELTKRFDRIDLTVETMRVSAEELERDMRSLNPDLMAALEFAAKRIRAFHERQLPEGIDYTDDAGVRLGYRWTPVGAVGLYVPGGTASYPSSVLMNAIPAKVAGVERIVMVVPSPDGSLDPAVLATARLAGIDEIYRIGGAQAVGALAYGTATIAPVDKIVGPGNAYVAEAKRQVFGTVGIDMIAGPSEILVVADGDNDPNWIAADLMSQAEHDTAAQSILITDDADFAARVEQAVIALLNRLPRANIAGPSWQNHGAIITVPDLNAAVPLIDRIAPEHLELAVADPDALADKVRNAGSIFLGRFTPEAIGDYLGGPNHVLPTARSARFSSGLGVHDFMKRTTFLGCTAESLDRIGQAAVTLGKAERLDAHAMSVAVRLDRTGRD